MAESAAANPGGPVPAAGDRLPAVGAPVPAIGDQLPALTAGPFTLMDFVRWAGFTENWYRLHYDQAYVHAHYPFPDVIQSGNHRTAYVARMVTDWLGAAGELRSLEIRHSTPVCPGDTLCCAGAVRAVTGSATAGYTVQCDVWATNQRGQKTTQGVVVAYFYPCRA